MRIDKVIDYLTKKIFPPSLIYAIVKGNISWKLKYFAFLISCKKRILLLIKGPFKGLFNLEKKATYNIPAESFSADQKKNGISALGRFKNSQDFLEICIKSILPFVDEIIMLVDQNSTDQTDKICKRLAEQYPEKCTYYPYTPEVYPGNHPKYAATLDNSVHGLSYFYNYCMSKATYKYVMKFDDDMLCVGEDFGILCDQIRNDGLDHFLDIPQINISRDHQGKLAIANKYLSSGIAGIFGDHGIFPLSEKTYFFNDTGCENLIAPYAIKYASTIGFLHLKNLKLGGGMKNYSGYGVEFINQLNAGTGYIPLPKQYIDLLKYRGIE